MLAARKTLLNESTIRRRADRAGYRVRRSRQWKHVPNLDNHGNYMLIDTAHNWCVLGDRFDATLEDIAEFLKPDDAKGDAAAA